MPNQERKVLENLFRQGFDAFLPLQKVVRQWSDREKKLLIPLFPNYLFVKDYNHDNYKILSTPGVVRFLCREGKLDTVSQTEIDLIENIVHHNPEVTSEKLLRGDVVSVVRGPFKGMRGMLEHTQGRCRMFLKIEAISKAVLIDISADCVEKCRMAATT